MTLVILLGAPGAGKSTVGALLAKKLKLAFVDTDKVIEEISGKSVSQIFVDDGEDLRQGGFLRGRHMYLAPDLRKHSLHFTAVLADRQILLRHGSGKCHGILPEGIHG